MQSVLPRTQKHYLCADSSVGLDGIFHGFQCFNLKNIWQLGWKKVHEFQTSEVWFSFQLASHGTKQFCCTTMHLHRLKCKRKWYKVLIKEIGLSEINYAKKIDDYILNKKKYTTFTCELNRVKLTTIKSAPLRVYRSRLPTCLIIFAL